MTKAILATPRKIVSVEKLLGREPIREFVPRDRDISVRWHTHDYPSPLARWNSHPEYEVHLINASRGQFIVGDYIGNFAPGHLVLVGPNLPHDWISNLEAGVEVKERDVVFQFHGDWLDACSMLMSEWDEVESLQMRAARGIEFTGNAATRGADELRKIGECSGINRLAHIFALLHVLSSAPAHEYKLLSNEWMPMSASAEASAVVNEAIEYVLANLNTSVRLSVAADIAGMSISAFSKYFKKASGHTFSDMVKRLRLTQASKILRHSEKPISMVAAEVGYKNISNFNRQFLAQYNCTPSHFRTRSREL